VEHKEDPFRPLFAAVGSGCHPVREIALLRALTEAAQSRLTAISGSRDDMPRDQYRGWREPAALQSHRTAAQARGTRRFSAVPSFRSGSFEEDVAWELDAVRRAGRAHVIVIDLTLAEIGLPVVRVVIPGMEGMKGVE
jgi:ribosomal protein S12 methylthiotransferase accessory factor